MCIRDSSTSVPKIITLTLLVFVQLAIKVAKKTRQLHYAVSGRKWARVAYLQRHLSATYIKLNISLSEFVYYARLSTKPTKNLRSVSSTFSTTGGRKLGKIIKITTSSILREKFQVRTQKNFLNAYCSLVHSKSSNRYIFGHFVYRYMKTGLVDFARNLRKVRPCSN